MPRGSARALRDATPRMRDPVALASPRWRRRATSCVTAFVFSFAFSAGPGCVSCFRRRGARPLFPVCDSQRPVGSFGRELVPPPATPTSPCALRGAHVAPLVHDGILAERPGIHSPPASHALARVAVFLAYLRSGRRTCRYDARSSLRCCWVGVLCVRVRVRCVRACMCACMLAPALFPSAFWLKFDPRHRQTVPRARARAPRLDIDIEQCRLERRQSARHDRAVKDPSWGSSRFLGVAPGLLQTGLTVSYETRFGPNNFGRISPTGAARRRQSRCFGNYRHGGVVVFGLLVGGGRAARRLVKGVCASARTSQHAAASI